MKRVHFIAVGGAVMHQLALALQRTGHTVTGSDDEITDPARTNLQAAGILPDAFGWHPERISADLDAIVLGMHARIDNPELVRARELNIPIYSFPEYVYEVSRDKKRIVIAGSHGKTTITSMVMHVLKAAGLSFDYLVGARVEGFEGSVKLSDAPIIVLEGDEYPASAIEKRPKIFFYHPHVSVLSGIAWDHVNVFPTRENYVGQFRTYLEGMEPGARLFYNGEDPEVTDLVGSAAGHLQASPYTTPPFHYEDGNAVLDTEDGPVTLSVFGRHNIQNMAAARAVCLEAGVDEKTFYEAIASFSGAARRLEPLLRREGLVAYRDFAHAPSKLRATLSAVREAYPDHRLAAFFELHTFSSLSAGFLQEYSGSMSPADDAVVYFSKHALQLKGLPELDHKVVCEAFGDNVRVIDDPEVLQTAVQRVLATTTTPICLLLMSSGTFDGKDWVTVLNRE